MKAVGITRRLDNLGRVTLPKCHRGVVGIGEGDAVEIIPLENGFLIQKAGESAKKQNIIMQLELGLKAANNNQIAEILKNTLQYVEGL